MGEGKFRTPTAPKFLDWSILKVKFKKPLREATPYVKSDKIGIRLWRGKHPDYNVKYLQLHQYKKQTRQIYQAYLNTQQIWCAEKHQQVSLTKC